MPVSSQPAAGTAALSATGAAAFQAPAAEPAARGAVLWTARYNVGYDAAPGSRIWVRRRGKPNSVTVASAIVVSPASGAVYVTGFTGGQSARSDNYLTVAYHG